MERISLLIFTVLMILLLTACGGEKIETNMSEDVANFVFTTQDDNTFGREDLEGKWWVAYFLYTDCGIICPTTTPHMASLQEELKEAGSDIQIVSFTVDPENDTPDVLKKYAETNQVDLSNWTFLTGYDFKDIKRLSEGSFQSALANGGPESMEYSHTTNFFLVNREGKVIKRYDGMIMDEVDRLIDDVKTVS